MTVNVGGVPVRLLFDADDLTGLGKFGQESTKGCANGGKHAVKQDEWNAAGAVNLVVHLQTVDRGVAAFHGPDCIVVVCHGPYPLWFSGLVGQKRDTGAGYPRVYKFHPLEITFVRKEAPALADNHRMNHKEKLVEETVLQ